MYERRRWNQNGVPTLEKLKALGIDYPDITGTIKKH
jgi:aldehyde:ferredoxin oxidoreductase